MTVEKKKPRVMVWLLVAMFVTGLLIVIGSIWDWMKIPVTPTNVLWFVTCLTAIIFGLMYLGSREKRVEQPTTAARPADEHAPPAHTQRASGSDHDGHMSNGQSWLYWSIGFLVFILTVLAFGFGLKALLGPGPARNSDARPATAQSQRLGIPANACSTVPVDARIVIAPVGACSAPIVIDLDNVYVCSTPGQASGQVRTKNWYGPTEPTSWESGNAPGDHTCVGAASDRTTPLAVRVWTEPYKPIP